jgi:hypothetical protein
MGRQVFVGTKVLLPDETPKAGTAYRGMEFYCVSVGQSYNFGSPWTTQLALTRGHNPKALRDYHNYRKFDQPAGDANFVYSADKDRTF